MKKFVFVFMLLLIGSTFAIWLDSSPDSSHIGVGVDDMGLFSVGVPPNNFPTVRPLLNSNYRGSPNGGHFNLMVDDMMYSSNPLLFLSYPDSAQDIGDYRLASSYTDTLNWWLETDWLIEDAINGNNNISIKQIMQPQELSNTGTVAMKWIIRNGDVVAHDIGLMVYMDTKINANDSAKVIAPGIPWSDSLLVLPDSLRDYELPAFWQAYEIGPDVPDSIEQLVAKGILIGYPNTTPDRIAFGDSRDFLGTYWNPTGLRDIYKDSGVLVWWFPVTAPPGTTMIIQTSYGLADSAAVVGGIYGMSVSYARNLVVSRCDLLPNPFTLTVAVTNNDSVTAGGMMANLDLTGSSYLSLPTGESTDKPTNPDTLDPGETGFVFWNVLVDPRPTMDATESFVVSAYSDSTISSSPAFDVFIRGSDFMGPEAILSEPLMNTISSDPLQPIKIYLYDAIPGVDTNRIFFRFITASGCTLNVDPSDPRLSYENDTLYYTPAGSLSNGSYYSFVLLQAEDQHGCVSDTVPGRFLSDQTGPTLGNYFPPSDTVVNDSLIVNWINCIDALGSIRDESIVFTALLDVSSLAFSLAESTGIAGVTLAEADPMVVGAPDTVLWTPGDWSCGLGHIPDGYVTMRLVRLTDDPDYGIPNPCVDIPFDWSYIMNAHGPRAKPYLPYHLDYVSVPDTDVTFYLYDGNSLIMDSTFFFIDGGVITPDGTGPRDSLHTIPIDASAGFTHGYEVMCEVLRARDSFYTPLDEGSYTSWHYTIDISSPHIISTNPANSDTVGIDSLEVTMVVQDSFAGVNLDSLEITYNGGTLPTDITVVGGTVTFTAIGLSDSCVVHVRVCDDIDVGPANWLDTSFVFYTNLAGPRAYINGLTEGFICSGSGPLIWNVTDPDGIEESSMTVTVNGDTFAYGVDSELDYDDVSGDLTFIPGSGWLDGFLVEACLESAEDSYGYTLLSPICGSWLVDTDPPDWSYDITDDSYYYPSTDSFDDTTLVIDYTWGDGALDSVMLDVIGPHDTLMLTEGDAGLVICDTMITFDGPAVDFAMDSFETYYFILSAKTLCAFSVGDWDTFRVTIHITPVEEDAPKLPVATTLHPNRPNPFNATTVVPFSIDEPGMVRLVISDMMGHRVKTLVSENRNSGYYEVVWDGRDDHGNEVPSGVYNCRMEFGGRNYSKKITLLR